MSESRATFSQRSQTKIAGDVVPELAADAGEREHGRRARREHGVRLVAAAGIEDRLAERLRPTPDGWVAEDVAQPGRTEEAVAPGLHAGRQLRVGADELVRAVERVDDREAHPREAVENDDAQERPPGVVDTSAFLDGVRRRRPYASRLGATERDCAGARAAAFGKLRTMSSSTSEPRAKGLTASAPAAETVVDWGTAYELVLGLRMFVDRDEDPASYAVGAAWFDRTPELLGTDVLDAIERYSGGHEILFGYLLALAAEAPAPRDASAFLSALAATPALELRRILLGHRLATYRGDVSTEVVAAAAEGRREAERALLDGCADWQRPAYEHALSLDADEAKSLLQTACEGWNASVLHPDERTTARVLRRSARAIGALAERLPLEELLDTATRGIRYTPEPGIERILLVPNLVSRPVVDLHRVRRHEDRLLRRPRRARHGRRAARPAGRRLQGPRRRDAPPHPAQAGVGPGHAPRAHRAPRAGEVDGARPPARAPDGWARRDRHLEEDRIRAAPPDPRGERGAARDVPRRNGGVMRYKLLGRSGLRVSELALGTMTFGETWGWGASKEESRAIFDAFVEEGGNFVDTACNYTDGESERFVGELIRDDREHFVVATKYTLTQRRDDPNAGGNQRKNMVQTLESSLRRLGTDYVDLLWLHMWDGMTPVEEVLRGFDDLVSSGKVLYVALSDTPAWVVSQAVTMADLRGWARPVAVQFSLLARGSRRRARAAPDGRGRSTSRRRRGGSSKVVR